MNTKLVVSTVCSPREQHIAWLSGLLHLKDFISKVIVIGQPNFNSVAVNILWDEVVRQLDVSLENREMRLWEARALQLQLVSHLPPTTQYVLFLDDDVLLTADDLKRLMALCNQDTAGIALQSNMRPQMASLRGRPSFDFFCSILPFPWAKRAGEDARLLEMIRKYTAIESFLIDWWGRDKGLMFNILTEPVFHIRYTDSVKIWDRWSWEYWDEMYQEVFGCRTIDEVDEKLSRRVWLP